LDNSTMTIFALPSGVVACSRTQIYFSDSIVNVATLMALGLMPIWGSYKGEPKSWVSKDINLEISITRLTLSNPSSRQRFKAQENKINPTKELEKKD
jgi:hypothetical protein